MRKITILFAVVLFSGMYTDALAQWQYNGSNIYFNNGLVGIGTDNPLGKLHLAKPGGVSIVFTRELGTSGEKSALISYEDATSGFEFRVDNDGSGWAGKTKMVINDNGNVGVNTLTPSEKLEVSGKIKSSGSNSALILVSPDGTEWELTVDNAGNLTTSQVMKISEVKNLSEIIVFPNPTDNKLTIDLKENKNGKIELHDISGKLIYTASYKTNSILVNMNSFESGVYILNIKNAYGVLIKTEKIVKK